VAGSPPAIRHQHQTEPRHARKLDRGFQVLKCQPGGISFWFHGYGLTQFDRPALIDKIWRASAGSMNAGYPDRFAQQALGHNSKAVHHAYSKHAEVTVPSLDDWEKEWGENSQRNVQPKVLLMDFLPKLTTDLNVN
jgi:hypothetical protein